MRGHGTAFRIRSWNVANGNTLRHGVAGESPETATAWFGWGWVTAKAVPALCAAFLPVRDQRRPFSAAIVVNEERHLQGTPIRRGRLDALW